MKLQDTSMVNKMGVNELLCPIKLLHNLGLHHNPNFKFLWRREAWSDANAYRNFLGEYGRQPHIATGKVYVHKLKSRLICYLQIPGEFIDPIVGIEMHTVEGIEE